MDPVIEEICRVKRFEPVQPRVLWRWQDYLRDVVQPKLDRVETLEARVAELEAAAEGKRRGRVAVGASA